MVEPFRKVTDPVGIPADPAAVTVAVIVTAVPRVGELGEVANVVVVVAGATGWTTRFAAPDPVARLGTCRRRTR